jgi:hypothetical protein
MYTPVQVTSHSTVIQKLCKWQHVLRLEKLQAHPKLILVKAVVFQAPQAMFLSLATLLHLPTAEWRLVHRAKLVFSPLE